MIIRVKEKKTRRKYTKYSSSWTGNIILEAACKTEKLHTKHQVYFTIDVPNECNEHQDSKTKMITSHDE